jgi:dTDP-4-amino-4,6-dideoxygalactose transaminase
MTILQSSTLALEGGAKVREKPWPQWPERDEREEQAVLDVIRSGAWWGGSQVPRFEKEFAALHDAAYAVCVTNGTAALEVCLRALGIGCGDEIIVPPYTFIATASSVLSVSATPVFVDIDPHTLNIDPNLIEAAITPRTRAIIPVHIAGCPANLDGVLELARKYDLFVIEDAAQAHLAAWKGRRVGAIGNLGTFSFQASKNLNAGEGGIILSNDEELADKVWSVANVGRVRSGKWYEHHVLGSNFRMTEFQAALLLAQMSRLEEQTQRRSANAATLTELLTNIPGITLLCTDPRVSTHAYHIYIFRYNPAGFGNRPVSEFIRALNAEGVPSSLGYVPLYKERVFQDKTAGQGAWCRAGRLINYADVDCPVCEQVCQDAVWLYQTMLLGNRADMEDIAEAIRKIQAAWG